MTLSPGKKVMKFDSPAKRAKGAKRCSGSSSTVGSQGLIGNRFKSMREIGVKRDVKIFKFCVKKLDDDGEENSRQLADLLDQDLEESEESDSSEDGKLNILLEEEEMIRMMPRLPVLKKGNSRKLTL